MADSSYSYRIAGSIIRWLDENQWNYQFDSDRGMILLNVVLKSQLKKLSYAISIYPEDFTVYASSPLGPDPKNSRMMHEMMEYIFQVNWNLKCGAFQLDLRDGELRFKCFADCEGIELSDQIIQDMIFCPASMFERYSRGFLGILFSGWSADQAMEDLIHPMPPLPEKQDDQDDSPQPPSVEQALQVLSGQMNISIGHLRNLLEEYEQEEEETDLPRQFDA